MKTPRLLTLGIASMLLMPCATHAVTDIWNGGSLFSDDLDANQNWADFSAPVSDIANTNLIFAGTIRLTPLVEVVFSARSITFNNTAGAFGIGGQQFNIGAGGIVNQDTQTMTFGNLVDFSAPGTTGIPTINAAVGGLSFLDTVTLPLGTLTVTGSGSTFFAEIRPMVGSTGAAWNLIKAGSGTMTWAPDFKTTFDVIVDAGTLTLSKEDSFGSALAVNGTSTLNLNEGITIDSGQLTRASGATINIGAGKTFTVQDGGTANITGAFSHASSGPIIVTGAGSTFSTTSTLTLGGGSTTSVLLGGSVSAGAGTVNVGTSGDGVVNVSNGSFFDGGNLVVGLFGNAGSVTFSGGSTGAFSHLDVDASSVAGTSGVLSIQSGSIVTGTTLDIATNGFANDGTVLITGAGSTLTVTGSGGTTINIGAFANSTGTLHVNSNGTFNSGLGLTIVHPTGTIDIDSAFYHSQGNLRIDGGKLTRNIPGVLSLNAGTTLTVQNGGDVIIDGAFTNNSASTITVTGAGSIFTTNSTLSVNGGSTLGILLGGDVSSGAGTIRIGTSGNGAVTVDGAGSTLVSGAALIGLNGSAGSLIFANASAGALEAISVNDSGGAGTSGLLQIQSGAVVTGTSLVLSDGLNASTGTVTITGAGSALTLNGASTATVGAASTSTGTLNVNSNGTFNSSTGLTTVNATGTIAIAGGTYNANGSLTLNGGQLTRDAAGVFALDAGRTFRVQAGGDAVFTGGFANSTASTMVVTGAGSTLTTGGGALDIHGSSTLSVGLGGSVSTGGGNVTVGAFGGNGTMVVGGAGANLSGNTLNVGLNGNTGSLTFLSGGSGDFGVVRVAASGVAGTVGTLSIQTGATVTGTSLAVASSPAATTGTIIISGAGSALTLDSALSSTIGAISGSSATLTVENGGTFTTSTGRTTVNATGDLNINNGGTMIVRGDMTIHSALEISAGGTVILSEDAPLAPAAFQFAEAEVGMSSNLDLGTWKDGAFASAGSDLAAVPEPGVGALLATGLMLLGMRRRRSCEVSGMWDGFVTRRGRRRTSESPARRHSNGLQTRPTIANAIRISLAGFLSASAFAQGPLNPPPGPPAPSMKSLTQIEPRIEISAANTPGDATSVFLITQPGSYYLSANLTAPNGKNGLKVQGSDVHIDLNGFAVIGGNSSTGILIDPGSSRVEIHNGAVRSFINGVSGSSPNIRVRNLIVGSCITGILLGSAALVENCTVSDCQTGISITSGRVAGCTVREARAGIALTGTTDAGTVADCTVQSINPPVSNGIGISAGEGAVISGCSVRGFGGRGIVAGTDAIISGCSAVSNGQFGSGASGIAVGFGSSVTNCTARGNTGPGFDVASGGRVMGSVARSNGSYGVVVSFAGTVQGCNVTSNGDGGIYVPSVHSLVKENHVVNNGFGTPGGSGIHVTGTANRIEHNHVNQNHEAGILLESGGNILLANSAKGNNGAGPAPAPAYVGVAGNIVGTIVDSSAGLNDAANNANANIR